MQCQSAKHEELALCCRLEDAIAAKQDDMVRLQAKQAMSDKAMELSAAQVAELQGALQDQAESLESSESSREALQVLAWMCLVLIEQSFT